jgi:hypothetical protein
MAGRQTTFQSSKSTAGAALAGIGMFVLYLHLTAAVTSLGHMLSAGGSAALALLVTVIPSLSQAFEAYDVDHHRFLQHVLVSCWPLLLVVVGTVLARDSSGCATALLQENKVGRVDQRSDHSTSK